MQTQPRSSSRRRFLQSASLAGVPLLLPSGLWGAENPPGDQITVGFIGMGKQSRGLLNGFMNSGARVVAVCDVDKNRREAEKARVDQFYKNQDCAAYEDFREITSRGDIDAVCIATPDHWHAIQILAALEGGKDVYCEKPLTQTIHESVAVMEAVQRQGRILQTGSMQRSSREFRVACELVRHGVIGKLERVVANFGGPGVPCELPGEAEEPGLNWDRWLGPAPARPYNSVLSPRGVHDHFPAWRTYREYGGGMVTDWGAHQLDIVQWGLGKDGSGPVEARPPGTAGSSHGAQLVYEGGLTVTHENGGGVSFYGEDGEVFVHRGLFGFVHQGKAHGTKRDRERDKEVNLSQQLDVAEETFLKDAKERLYRSKGHVVDFLEAVRSREKPITHEGIGSRTAICCHLLNLTYYHGQTLRWDPAGNRFVEGTGRPEWLTRDYRGEWKV